MPAGFRVVVTLLAFSGLRVSEALGLRWRNVRLVDGELDVREQLQAGRRGRDTKVVERLKSEASYRTVPIFPAVEHELAALLERRLAELRAGNGGRDVDPRALDDELVFRSRTGRPLSSRNVAQRGVTEAASSAGLGHVTPQLLRSSFCSLAGRRRVDPVEAAQLTGHSLAVWTQNYARSFGKAQRDEARARMLEHGFGAVADHVGRP
jgi:integrase